MSKSQRFRPHQAHYKHDMSISQQMSQGMSTEGELWTRQHASLQTTAMKSSTKLPYIGAASPGSSNLSPQKMRPKAGELPAMRTKSNPEDLSAGLLMQQQDSLSKSSKTLNVTVSDWKNDEGLQTWYKDICQRKKEAKAKQLRQANKDAQWILDRREKQMKEIQKIQKAEQEAEAKSRRMQNYNALNKFQAPTLGNKEEQSETPAVKSISFEGSHHNHETLQWQEIPEPARHKKVAKDVAVWVKPGVFVTKNLM
mmetsp:Transcript_42241/g.51277  ORF Transcript_42241/g.51277 Transcript_42241/m.51277 type:complete len:254 (+) Transcript_42241:337-1098(+)